MELNTYIHYIFFETFYEEKTNTHQLEPEMDKVVFRRARHVIGENKTCKDAALALKVVTT